MYRRCSLIFWLCKRFHCIYSSLYQHIIEIILFIFRRKASQGFLDASLKFATGHARIWFLLGVDCLAFLKTLKASIIRHGSGKCSVSLDWPFCAGVIIRHHYEALVFSNQMTQEHVRKTFGNGVTSITVVDFTTRAFIISERFLDSTRKKRSAWILPTHFCCMRAATDSRYQLQIKPLKFNVELEHKKAKNYFCKFLFSTARLNCEIPNNCWWDTSKRKHMRSVVYKQ